MMLTHFVYNCVHFCYLMGDIDVNDTCPIHNLCSLVMYGMYMHCIHFVRCMYFILTVHYLVSMSTCGISLHASCLLEFSFTLFNQLFNCR